MARWERQDRPTNLVDAAPQNPSTLPGIAFFVFAIIHIFAFPILAALVESHLYGTVSKSRQLKPDHDNQDADVSISNFTKRYEPSWWARNISARLGKKKETVVAVNNLDLEVPRGQIMVLLGGKIKSQCSAWKLLNYFF